MYQNTQISKHRSTSHSLFLSLILLSLSFCFLPNSQVALAQNNGSTPSGMQNELKLKDGTTLKGEILEQMIKPLKLKRLVRFPFLWKILSNLVLDLNSMMAR